MATKRPITLRAGAPSLPADIPPGAAMPMDFSIRPLRLNADEVSAVQESFGVLIASNSMTRSIVTELDVIVVLRFDADQSIHAAVMPWSRLALRTGPAPACVRLPGWAWALVSGNAPSTSDVRNAPLRHYLTASGVSISATEPDLVPTAALRTFQERRGVPVTGVLDEPTGRLIVRDLVSQAKRGQ